MLEIDHRKMGFSMLAIPVVEVRAGRCVHTHTEATKQSVVMDDPIERFTQLVEQGAEQIQIVDVDAIRNRQPEHLALVSQLKDRFPGVNLQVSAGVKHSDDIQIWLDAGADLVTIGGRLLRDYDNLELILVELGERLVVTLDVKAKLWQQDFTPIPNMNFAEWIAALQDEGVAALMFTEIPDNGHINGHSLLSAAELAKHIALPVIAHGGVWTRKDLLSLSSPGFDKLHGVTVGKPMFDGVFSYREAVSMLTH
ncbi:MAG: HisA/HisF-related TIM barrel protein [Kangiellaceae bacterium]|jgi:phosphoribosylformimino-5-aminoimidazole carboxamide ribotide isomerase|nr:HisA/HisF-related TIM barrel protein [Kangiellaceae bacterium]